MKAPNTFLGGKRILHDLDHYVIETDREMVSLNLPTWSLFMRATLISSELGTRPFFPVLACTKTLGIGMVLSLDFRSFFALHESGLAMLSTEVAVQNPSTALIGSPHKTGSAHYTGLLPRFPRRQSTRLDHTACCRDTGHAPVPHDRKQLNTHGKSRRCQGIQARRSRQTAFVAELKVATQSSEPPCYTNRLRIIDGVFGSSRVRERFHVPTI